VRVQALTPLYWINVLPARCPVAPIGRHPTQCKAILAYLNTMDRFLIGNLFAPMKRSRAMLSECFLTMLQIFSYTLYLGEMVCCVESINDCLMNPISTLNTIHIDALEDSTYLVCRAFHIQNPSTLVFPALSIQNLPGYLPDCEISQVYGCIGNQIHCMQATGLLVPLILLVRFLLEHNDNGNPLFVMRYGRPCPFSIDVTFSDRIDKLTSYVASIYPQIHHLLATATCDASTASFVCETIQDAIVPV
jgi:hypothetical protein